ncbi:MAG: divalent-cation tolerance protein CutA [Longimicrobiales bacterium]
MATDSPPTVLTILSTAPDAGVGERIVRKLLDEGLIACGNIVPGVVSLYRWEGEVRRDAEVLIVMKSVERLIPALLERATELHPYDVPELLVQPVRTGAAPYLEWVENECA